MARAKSRLQQPDYAAHHQRSMAVLLSANGFEIISRDGKERGCFDLDRPGLLGALDKLCDRRRSALIYYADDSTRPLQIPDPRRPL